MYILCCSPSAIFDKRGKEGHPSSPCLHIRNTDFYCSSVCTIPEGEKASVSTPKCEIKRRRNAWSKEDRAPLKQFPHKISVATREVVMRQHRGSIQFFLHILLFEFLPCCWVSFYCCCCCPQSFWPNTTRARAPAPSQPLSSAIVLAQTHPIKSR